MGIGVLSTLAFALLYLVLHPFLGALAANAVALAVTAVANTAANRRFTFQRPRPRRARCAITSAARSCSCSRWR